MNLYDKGGLTYRSSIDGENLILNSAASFKKLKEDKITSVEINDSLGFQMGNLSFLSDCTQVERISIVCLKKIDLTSIHHLTNLRVLNTTQDYGQVIDIGKFPQLRKCQLFWNSKLSNLQNAHLLEELILHNYKGDTFQGVVNSPFLKKLSLIKSTLLSLKGVEKFKELSTLELTYLNKLVSVEALAGLPNLKRLDIENCPNVKTLDALSGVSNLEFLGMHDCKKIESLKPLMILKRLSTIYISGNTDVVDGDMSPLIGRKDASIGTRRHYSHKSEEIDKLNGTIRPKQTWDY
jgi:Leucine-rich repeat (LRR) protein